MLQNAQHAHTDSTYSAYTDCYRPTNNKLRTAHCATDNVEIHNIAEGVAGLVSSEYNLTHFQTIILCYMSTKTKQGVKVSYNTVVAQCYNGLLSCSHNKVLYAS